MKAFYTTVLVHLLLLILCACSHSDSLGKNSNTAINNIDTFEWENRIILIQAQAPCSRENEILIDNKAAIDERHIIWFLICNSAVKTNYKDNTDDSFSKQIQQQYFLNKQHSVVLIGKDGDVKHQSQRLDLREIYQRIDAMPMRQSEMREQ